MTLLSLFFTVLYGVLLLSLWVSSVGLAGGLSTAIGVWVGLFTGLCFIGVYLYMALQILGRFNRGQ